MRSIVSVPRFGREVLANVVVALPACQDGPGRSCLLDQYNDEVLAGKWTEAGSFADFCEIEEDTLTTNPETGGVTFWSDITIEAIREVVP
jgi:acid phosphatase